MSTTEKQIVPSDDSTKWVHGALQNLTEGLSGIAASDRKQWALSLGHVLQRARAGDFLAQFLKEWNKYREKGLIKDDFAETEQYKACLTELLDYLDTQKPDQREFDFVQRVFLAAATETSTDRASVLPREYMKIAKSLDAGEILILSAAYRVSEDAGTAHAKGSNTSASEWLSTIASESGLGTSALVEAYEESLMEKRLITQRVHSDRSGVEFSEHYRLTQLGYDLLRFVLADNEEDPTGQGSE